MKEGQIMSAQKIIKIVGMLMLLFTLAGCSTSTETEMVTYEQITAETAKMLMDTETNYIIIDARTEEEYAAGHIPGAILMPEYEVADRAESELPDKNQLILVYCRSGRRSKIAADTLAYLGYTNVKEFGGIIDWTYETTTY